MDRSVEGYSPWGHTELNMTERNTHVYMCMQACCLQRGGLWTPFVLGNNLATRETGSYGFKE